MIKKLIFTLFIIVASINAFSQDSIPKNYFRSPLGIPLFLAGNFGELRSNHFHSGLDMKTQGKEGFKIYAAADGYISRIKVSPWGYGKTIYIDHPNGYTTVYAHLQQYKGIISKKIKQYQNEKESWEIDWYPSDTLMKIKKGDVIALSGNTGGSGGPHLHFEVRETESEFPINPLLLGFDIKDNIKPTIKSIVITPLNDTSYVNNKQTPQRFLAVGVNGIYKLKYGAAITAYGEIGIGIETIDKLNGVSNRNGIYSIELSQNTEIIFKSEMKKFSFGESRALNSLIDYKMYLGKKIRFQRSFIEPNNHLQIYTQHKNNGVIHFAKNDKNAFKYIIKDTYRNTSTISFPIIGEYNKSQITPISKPTIDTLFSYIDSNYFENQNIMIGIPKDALYKDLPFHFSIADTLLGAITPTYFVHSDYTPLHKAISVSIKVGRLSEYERSKATIVHFDRRKRYYAKGGTWRNNYITTKSKAFGGFAVMIDTIPPKITPTNIFANKNMSKNTSITIKIADNLSGIKSYRGTIDGKWIMMEYEAKKAKIFYTFDNLPKGKHNFELTLTDGVGNTSNVSIPFVR
ncbi:MAG: M23 family metallopeptidase [Flavobacteriales bacterium]|nr:M23 family metallopeptidase [Flavobacteriales bacterium]